MGRGSKALICALWTFGGWTRHPEGCLRWGCSSQCSGQLSKDSWWPWGREGRSQHFESQAPRMMRDQWVGEAGSVTELTAERVGESPSGS